MWLWSCCAIHIEYMPAIYDWTCLQMNARLIHLHTFLLISCEYSQMFYLFYLFYKLNPCFVKHILGVMGPNFNIANQINVESLLVSTHFIILKQMMPILSHGLFSIGLYLSWQFRQIRDSYRCENLTNKKEGKAKTECFLHITASTNDLAFTYTYTNNMAYIMLGQLFHRDFLYNSTTCAFLLHPHLLQLHWDDQWSCDQCNQYRVEQSGLCSCKVESLFN